MSDCAQGYVGDSVADLGHRAKAAAPSLSRASTEQKNNALLAAASGVSAASSELLAANAADVARAEAAGTSAAIVDRLRLTVARIEAMAAGLRDVARLDDPVGEIVSGWTRPNGLRIAKTRVPLGVVAIIYENRPNVTSDAFGLCCKSGNVAFLRGSSAAIESNRAIAGVLRQALHGVGLPADGLILVEDTSYEAATQFMQLRGSIDVLIPRGGPSLIRSILENATVPYVIDGDGNCHLFVDASADLDMALEILVNGKTQRPSVCNALESLLVHEAVATRFLPMAAAKLENVVFVGDVSAQAILGAGRIALATPEEFACEFLDLKISIAVVTSLDEAIAHIATNGTGHTEVIVTSEIANADRFTREVDAAAVVVNASSRFTDGEMFGFGAEIGISTQKLHARGPMGLRELTTTKYVLRGEGQIRP